MSTDLERRYRRLLLAYPASHRASHGEEMLGVLLDSAGPRTRPALADTADLIRGGVSVRLRRADTAGWGDAVAVIAVVTSMLVCTLAPMGLGFYLFSENAPRYGSLALMAWPLAVLAGLLGQRRTAAGLGIAATLALVATGAASWMDCPWIALATLASAATGAADPRRGWRALGWARAVMLAAGCGLLSGFLLLYATTQSNPWRTANLPGPIALREQAWFLLVAGALLVIASSFRVTTSAARRATLVLAAPLTALTLGLAGLMTTFDRRVVSIANTSNLEQLAIPAASLALALLAVVALSQRGARPQGTSS